MVTRVSTRWRNVSWAVTAVIAIYALVLSPRGIFTPIGATMTTTLIANTAGMFALFLSLGLAVTQRPLGILLNGRNVYSLALLQMILWTGLIMSALVAAAVCRGWAGKDALAITVPNPLLAAMGISFASAAAAPGLLALKSGVTPVYDEVAAAESRLGAPVMPSGRVVGRPTPGEAIISDLITGDELANAGIIDFSKVQQLLVTFLLIGVYFDLLLKLFGDPALLGNKMQLPDFDESFVNLMLISHGGYLAYKATSKPTEISTTLQRPLAPDRNAELQA